MEATAARPSHPEIPATHQIVKLLYQAVACFAGAPPESVHASAALSAARAARALEEAGASPSDPEVIARAGAKIADAFATARAAPGADALFAPAVVALEQAYRMVSPWMSLAGYRSPPPLSAPLRVSAPPALSAPLRVSAPPALGAPLRVSAPPPDVLERRRAPRAFLLTDVTFESEHNFYTGFTEDISEGGIFLATYDLEPMGSVIEVEFTLPDGYKVRTVGVVRWVRQPRNDDAEVRPGLGIQFEQLSEADSAAINDFIQARAPMFYDD